MRIYVRHYIICYILYNIMSNIDLPNHAAGFFSSTTIILFELMNSSKKNGINPISINSSRTFGWYRNSNNNIFFDFFKIKNINKLDNISWDCFDYNLRGDLQFKKYDNFNLDIHFKFVDVYFNLSDKVMEIYNNMIHKYEINYDNICCLFLRGNDKATECKIPEYAEYITKSKELLQSDPNLKFIIQSDEKEFIEEMCKNFPNNIVFNDDIRFISTNKNQTVDNYGKTPEINHKFALNFLAIVYIMSKCKYIICNSGNISVWILLYRKHLNNYFQLI